MPVVKVKGMSCQHCVKSVTEALEGLGAKDVKIELLSGDVNYEESAPIAPDTVKESITKIGFAPELGEWKKVKLHADCHVQFHKTYYSASWKLVRKDLWLRAWTREEGYGDNDDTSHPTADNQPPLAGFNRVRGPDASAP